MQTVYSILSGVGVHYMKVGTSWIDRVTSQFEDWLQAILSMAGKEFGVGVCASPHSH
jgi:hypothetical protein